MWLPFPCPDKREVKKELRPLLPLLTGGDRGEVKRISLPDFPSCRRG